MGFRGKESHYYLFYSHWSEISQRWMIAPPALELNKGKKGLILMHKIFSLDKFVVVLVLEVGVKTDQKMVLIFIW